MGEKLKDDNQFSLFLETSANFNKENIFIEAAKQLCNENNNIENNAMQMPVETCLRLSLISLILFVILFILLKLIK